MSEDLPYKREWLLPLHEALFCLNLAFAAGYAMLLAILTYTETRAGLEVSPLNYFFFRGSVRINSFLRTNYDNRAGRELMFYLSVASLVILFQTFVRMTARSTIYRVLLRQIAGISALFAVPAFWLLMLRWNAPSPEDLSESVTLWEVLSAELLMICLLLWLNRKHPLSAWTIGFLMILHYGFWISVLGEHLRANMQRFYFWISSPLCVAVVFLCSGFIWLYYIKRQPQTVFPPEISSRKLRWTVLGFIALALLCILWLPVPGHSFARPKDMNSVTLVMRREWCFGRCPVYALTMHGDGLVEYSGERFVGVCGQQTTTITSDQLTDLLQRLDRIHFSSLDDRAFVRCSDTPSVEISISMDGRQKSLRSDTYCVGSRPQAEFVKIAQDIDKIVRSEQWVSRSNHGSDCRNLR